MSHPASSRLPARWGRRLAAVGASAALVAATVAIGTAGAHADAETTTIIDARTLDELSGGSTGEFFVYFAARPELTSTATDRAGQAGQVYDQLTATAEASQAGTTALLTERGVAYTPFWITNAILVEGDLSLARELATQPGVSAIGPNEIVPLIEPVSTAPAEEAIQAVEWGVANINADQVWNEFDVRGEGIVVASIDTGVQYDHPALVAQYRGNLGGGQFDHNYNWVDPAGVCSPGVPCDNHGHGTHVTGTMVGDDGGSNQIGVAPAAQWIAAKGCESASCSQSSLLASGEWMVAPTDLNGQNPDPSRAPHIVNNSWGGGGGNTWYAHIVDAWVAAGIFPMFSNGNSGPGCGTAGSPGDYPQSYGIGAYDVNNQIANFSSRGPSAVDGSVKPNASAPGVNVRSSVPTNGYGTASGTSMASPHASGVVALMWSASADHIGDIGATRAVLDATARSESDLQCGGTADNNNVWGQGRIDAYAAVDQVLDADPPPPPPPPAGAITGTVTSEVTGGPLAGARVVLSHGPGGRYDTTTNAQGTYVIEDVLAGEYRVTITARWCTGDRDTVRVIGGDRIAHDAALSGQRCGLA